MWRSPVKNQGWTLIEMAVVAVIAGILSALAIPSMVGMQGRNELRDATNQVKSALQEAQRNAIKSGRRCRVLINATFPGPPPINYNISSTNSAIPANDPGTQPNPSGHTCISSPIQFSTTSQLSISSNFLVVSFSYKGNTVSTGTIVIESGKTVERRCIVVSNGVGILRTGIYTNKIDLPTLDPSTISASDCSTSL